MEEAVPPGLSSPVPSWGGGKQAQRGWRPSPNLVIRPLCVVFLLQKMLIYCNLKNYVLTVFSRKECIEEGKNNNTMSKRVYVLN